MREKIDFRLLVCSLTIIFLFFLINLFTWQFSSSVKFFLVKHKISYNFLEFIKNIFHLILFTIIIFLTGYNPLKWSKVKISQLRFADQKFYQRRLIQAISIVIIVLIIRFTLTVSFFNFNLKSMYLDNKSNYTFTFIFICFISAFYEELLFKGLLYRSFISVEKLKYVGMFITSLIFTLSHVFTVFTLGYSGIQPYLIIFMSSVLSLWVFNLYPSIWLVTIMHAVRNFFAYQL